MKLHRGSGVAQKTAWMMAKKIDEGRMEGHGRMFGGPVAKQTIHRTGFPPILAQGARYFIRRATR